VEFAMVLPVLIALLFTMIAAGSVLIDRLDLQSAARDAVRVASLDGADACGVAAGSLEGNDLTISSCLVEGSCDLGSVSVLLATVSPVSIPFVGDRTVELTADSSYAC
jgi:hypothetical protein